MDVVLLLNATVPAREPPGSNRLEFEGKLTKGVERGAAQRVVPLLPGMRMAGLRPSNAIENGPWMVFEPTLRIAMARENVCVAESYVSLP